MPFFRSRPSLPLVLSAVGVVIVGSVLPSTPLARGLGFAPLPVVFYAVLAAMIVCYLALIEAGKWVFYRHARISPAPAERRASRPHRLRRRAAHFSTSLPGRLARHTVDPNGRSIEP